MPLSSKFFARMSFKSFSDFADTSRISTVRYEIDIRTKPTIKQALIILFLELISYSLTTSSNFSATLQYFNAKIQKILIPIVVATRRKNEEIFVIRISSGIISSWSRLESSVSKRFIRKVTITSIHRAITAISKLTKRRSVKPLILYLKTVKHTIAVK